MASKTFDYPGDKIAVQYDVKRCIHAAECVHGLPGVFDTSRKPWIDPNAASADNVAEVVMRCPTGALHFSRQDDGPAEPIPDHNTITVAPDGPLFLRGNLEVTNRDGKVLATDTRLALCRCGASSNKPFCDGSHSKANFEAPGTLGDNAVKAVEAKPGDQGLKIKPAPSGPLSVKGEAKLYSADEQTCYSGNSMFLCRCGASANKPFCDGSHSQIGFSDE